MILNTYLNVSVIWKYAFLLLYIGKNTGESLASAHKSSKLLIFKGKAPQTHLSRLEKSTVKGAKY